MTAGILEAIPSELLKGFVCTGCKMASVVSPIFSAAIQTSGATLSHAGDYLVQNIPNLAGKASQIVG